MRLLTLEDVRKVLERRNGPIPNEVWETLVRMQIAEVALGNEGDLDYVEEKLRPLLDLYNTRQKRNARSLSSPKKETLPPDERLLALCEVLALHAARRRDVQAFRTEILGGRLIQDEDIPEWIERQVAKEGQSGHLLTVTVAVSEDALPPIGASVQEQLTAAQRAVAAGQPVRYGLEAPVIGYPTKDGAAQFTYVAFGGTLWRLKKLAQSLAKEYGWQEAQAVAFVLTGAVPLLPRGWVRLSWRTSGPRITLEVDPRLSRTEVARLYGRWRGRVFRGADKPIERKAARLAVFAEEYRDSGLSWRELMALWNQQYPEWKYHTAVHFARDCQMAWQRVTGGKWPRKKEGKRRGKEAGAR